MKFYHDSQEQYKVNIAKMISVHYNSGYGLYFRIKEAILDSQDKKILIDEKSITMYSKIFHSSRDRFVDFLNDCINEFNLFFLIYDNNKKRYLTVSEEERKGVIN